MKSFITSLCASLIALFVFFAGGLLMLLLVLSFAKSADTGTVVVHHGSYLVLDLTGNITDSPDQFDGSRVVGTLLGSGGGPFILQLRSVVSAIEHAATDDRITGLFITGNLIPLDLGSGFAALREVRGAIEKFKATGKPVLAYGTYPGTRELYLMSAANEIVLNPLGMVWMPGLASEGLFFKGAFEKFGIGVQVTRAGKFKSYHDPYVRTDFSPETRQELQDLLGDLWEEIRATVAAGRGLEPAELQNVVEGPEALRSEVALAGGMVDRLAYFDEVLAELRKRTGVDDESEPFKQIDIASYSRAAVRGGVGTGGSRNRVAVVYAEGTIVDGSGMNGEIGSDTFARELRRLRTDSDVKAVVLRVNSPGGSASASEEILREMQLLKAAKPTIVSMGTYAASGGYWISTHADRIFAQPNTVTGSIGVTGLVFNVKGLGESVGITFDTVKTGKFADFISVSRPKTESEMAWLQSATDDVYEQFIDRVVAGRKLGRPHVEAIAQGRVWSGERALDIGLVDEIGGLGKAIEFAAQKAGLGSNYRVVEFPRKKTFAEALQEMFEPGMEQFSDGGPVEAVVRQVRQELAALRRFNDPASVYALFPFAISAK
ncbi:MAG TPA: signal peptide peptidase SppA [Opitutaceae bacterium]